MKRDELTVALSQAMDNDSANASCIRTGVPSFRSAGTVSVWIGCGNFFASADGDSEPQARRKLLEEVRILAKREADKHEKIARILRVLLEDVPRKSR